MIGLHGWALLSLLDSTVVSIYRETQRNYGLSNTGYCAVTAELIMAQGLSQINH